MHRCAAAAPDRDRRRDRADRDGLERDDPHGRRARQRARTARAARAARRLPRDRRQARAGDRADHRSGPARAGAGTSATTITAATSGTGSTIALDRGARRRGTARAVGDSACPSPRSPQVACCRASRSVPRSRRGWSRRAAGQSSSRRRCGRTIARARRRVARRCSSSPAAPRSARTWWARSRHAPGCRPARSARGLRVRWNQLQHELVVDGTVELRLDWRLGAELGLRLGAAAWVPASRPRFVVHETGDVMVYQPAVVALVSGIAV